MSFQNNRDLYLRLNSRDTIGHFMQDGEAAALFSAQRHKWTN